MARKVRTFIDGDTPTDEALRPKHLSKQEFGKRLYKLMLGKGWNQSELSRQANISRDSVSTYMRGVSFPERPNLERLAKALGVDPDDLLPNIVEMAIDEDAPSLELKISSNDQRIAWLRINRLVSTSTSMKVIELLNKDTLPDRKENA